jgi:lysophospholipase L1-like esterase
MTTRASAFGLLFFPALALALLTACGDRPNQNHASLNRTSPSLAKPCTPANNAIGQHIVTAWKNAPSDALITHPISGLSVRQSFAPHWPGQTIRLRITNRYSSLPVVLDRVHVARERVPGSADVMPDSQCLLKFDGQSLVTLKPGESRVSDWTSYAIAPFERISISFFAPSLTPQVTRHLGANEFVYISTPGDHTADASGAAYLQTPDGYASNFLVIEALEVVSRPRVKTLVVVGDSITDGSDSTTGFLDGQGSPMTATDQRYPNHLQRRILKAGLPIAVANAGIGGNELLNDGWLPQFGPALLRRLDTDVLETAGVSHVLLMIGTNDFGNPHIGAAPTSAEMIKGLKSVIERVQAAGLKIVLGTIPPAEGAVWDGIPVLGATPLHVQIMHGTAAARRSRDETNAWIRQQTLSDGVVDFDTCLSDPDRPGYLAPQYNSGDNLHPSPLGYAAMADCVNLNLFSGA